MIFSSLVEGVKKLCKLKIDKVSALNISMTGFIRYADLANSNVAIRNNELFYLCNSIPAVSNAYVPSGDFINSYALFLDHLVPQNLDKSAKTKFRVELENKNALEKILRELMSDEEGKVDAHITPEKGEVMRGGKIKGRSSNIDNTIESIIQAEQNLKKILSSHSKYKFRADYKLSENIEILNEGLAKVSYSLGARKIEGKNKYNMPVNSIPIRPENSYSAGYSLKGFKEAFEKWETKSTERIEFEVSTAASTLVRGEEKSLIVFKVSKQKIKRGRGEEIKKFKMSNLKISFSALGIFDIEEFDWFNPNFFQLDGYSMISNSPNFLGTGGSLEQIPVQLILGYRMSLSIQLDKLEYQYFKSVKNSLLSTNDLGFSVENIDMVLSGPLKNSRIKMLEESCAIQIDSLDNDLPQVLGVVSRNALKWNN